MKSEEKRRKTTSKPATAPKRNTKRDYYTKYLDSIKENEDEGAPADGDNGKDTTPTANPTAPADSIEDKPPVKKRSRIEDATDTATTATPEAAPALLCNAEKQMIKKIIDKITPTINLLQLLKQKLITFRGCKDYAPCHVPVEVVEGFPCDMALLSLLECFIGDYEKETEKQIKVNLSYYVKNGLITESELAGIGIFLPTGDTP